MKPVAYSNEVDPSAALHREGRPANSGRHDMSNGLLDRVKAPLTGLLVALAAAGAVQAQDNPYNLLDADTVSVGSLGDAKPYAFTTAAGEFTGFDVEFLRNVLGRLGFEEDQILFTGQEFAALLPSVSNGRFDIAAAAIGITEQTPPATWHQ